MEINGVNNVIRKTKNEFYQTKVIENKEINIPKIQSRENLQNIRKI